jgi:hypothetical protein
MTENKKYIVLIVIVLTILVTACGAFEAKRGRIPTLSVDSVIAQINETLQADPNYIVTDSFIVHAKEPSCLVPMAFVDYLNLRLQVIVRKSSSVWITLPRWRMQIDRLFKWFPGFLRPNLLRSVKIQEDKRIDIYVLEPTDEEMKRLKEEVRSLGFSRDILIEISAHFPGR